MGFEDISVGDTKRNSPLILTNDPDKGWEPGYVHMPIPVGDISDGYHTFNELYAMRNWLVCAWLSAICSESGRYTWKSRKHNDGTEYEGWFIAGAALPNGQVTWHLPNDLWDWCYSPELDTAPQWDGHTSDDVIKRLKEWLR